MSDAEMSGDESPLYGDPQISDAAINEDEHDLRTELVTSYGDGILDDDQMPMDPEFASLYDDQEDAPLDFSRPSHVLSESESDDENPPTKNPLRALIKEAEKVCIY